MHHTRRFSKACYATYALCDYLIEVAPVVDTSLAFHFMSQPDDCDGTPYATPLIPLTSLPVASDHALIRTISDERSRANTLTERLFKKLQMSLVKRFRKLLVC